MLIKRVRIQNFRCLEDVDVTFDSVTTFIGPNGVGKSTVLRALDWFFNGGALTDEDVRHGATNRWIRVEVEFGDLTAADRTALGKYAPESRDAVKIWRTWEDGAEKMTGKAFAFPPFEAIRSSSEGAVARRGQYTALREAGPDLELLPLAANNWAAVETAMSDWEQAHPESLEEADGSDTHFFGFAGQGLMSGLFDYVLVTADLRASEETEDSRTSVLGRILERSINRASADTKLEELSSRFLREADSIHEEHFGSQLAAISRELSQAVEAFAPGRSVNVHPLNADVRPRRVQFSVSIQDGPTETRVDRQGHGFQRALLLSALKLLADRGAATDEQGVICLAVEEPELFQHPVQARAFASVLRNLAQDTRQQIQVTYATHSPFFVEAAHFPQIRRVSRSNGPMRTVGISHVSTRQVADRLDGHLSTQEIERRMEALCIEQLPEALFAEAVILVEGSTDQGVIEGCAERDQIFLAVDGIVVVEAHGKNGLLLPHAILTLLGIPCYLIFDGDKGSPDRVRASNKNKPDQVETLVANETANLSEANRKMLRYLGATVEDWPATGVYADYAVFEDYLECELEKSWTAFFESRDKLIADGVGFPRKHRTTYRLAAVKAADKAPEMFQEIIAAVHDLRTRM